MIRAPVVRQNPTFIPIDEPRDDELNQEIEKIRNSIIAWNNSATAIDWDHYASQAGGLASEIQTLKQTLAKIDQTVTDGITEMRLTAYHTIREAKTQHTTPELKAEAKQQTKKRSREFFAVGKKRQHMRLDRMNARDAIVKEKVNEAEAVREIVQQAIGRFQTRITQEFEPNRRKDIRNACVAFLQSHEHLDAGRREFLIDLVHQISPDASSKFDKTIAGPSSSVQPAAPEAALLRDIGFTEAHTRFLRGEPLSPDASSQSGETIAGPSSSVEPAASEAALLLDIGFTEAQMRFLRGEPLSKLDL